MTRERSLSSYLHHWNEHLLPDVEGQSAAPEHLDDNQLQALTKISKEMLKNASADLEHLSSCPSCMERWAELCRTAISQAAEDEPAAATICFGEQDADVEGQSATQVLTSACQRFSLHQETGHDGLRLTLMCQDPALKQAKVKLCDRSGRVLMAGKMESDKISTLISEVTTIDLSIWTVLVN